MPTPQSTPPSAVIPNWLAFLIPVVLAALVGVIWHIIAPEIQKAINPITISTQADTSSALKEITGDKIALIDSPTAISIGPEDAKVTIVEFIDFQCPYCKQAAPIMQAVRAYYKDAPVRFVIRQLPLMQIHPEALPAANAALCAHEQGKFWEYHDALFTQQALLGTTLYTSLAQQLHLNMPQFVACTESTKYQNVIAKDVSDAIDLGLRGTPTFFIDNYPIEGIIPASSLIQTIDKIFAQDAAASFIPDMSALFNEATTTLQDTPLESTSTTPAP